MNTESDRKYAEPAKGLRWCIDQTRPGFRSTREVGAVTIVMGQPGAVKVVQFGVQASESQNVSA